MEDNWIKCSDRLPERDVDVLAFNKPDPIRYPNGCVIASWDSSFDMEEIEWTASDGTALFNIIAWQPLPPNPQPL